MARPKKNTEIVTEEVFTSVVGSTFEDKKDNETLSGVDVVTLCVSLRNGHIFNDIPDGHGGYKKIQLAGLDDNQRGGKGGILTDKGNAVYQQMPRSDWEALYALHGKERMFNSWHGFPPCVFKVSSVSEAKRAKDIQDQIKETVTGLDPFAENSSI